MSKHPTPPAKICASCGREMQYRKKWEKNWDQVRYCSDECRKEKSDPKLEEMILSLLKTRGRGKTICPSEILTPEKKTDKAEMEKARRAARRLVAQGLIVITQGGKVVDPSDFKGPIRLRLK